MTQAPEEKPMKKTTSITCLFLDIGGVLLTDGWDRHARMRAAKNFNLDLAEMEDRHHLTFDTYEAGKLTLEEYLGQVVFCQKRPFTQDQFRHFMFEQSKPYPEMIELIARLKVQYGLKIAVVSNEARELNAYRIHEFKLDKLVDCFISSCFVHVRKPDPDIFRVAMDITPGASTADCLYRKHSDVRPSRGRLGYSRHSSHRLRFYVKGTGLVGPAEWRRGPP